MPSLKDIRKRISSVKNTQKITKAMKMVSAAKLRRAQERAQSSRPYEAQLLNIVSDVLRDREWSSELTIERPVKKVAVVVAATDRGLCGSLNSNLFKAVLRYMNENSSLQFEVIALGRRARDFFRKSGYKIAKYETDLLRKGSYQKLEEIAYSFQNEFLGQSYDQIQVFYNEFKSALVQKPTQLQFLPFVPEQPKEKSGVIKSYILEPQADELLNHLVPMLVNFRFYRVMIEAFASEHAARMAAMDSATSNAKDMIGRLTLQMNRARQAAITKELMEIIGGAEAISA